jgi:hypothetical protein
VHFSAEGSVVIAGFVVFAIIYAIRHRVPFWLAAKDGTTEVNIKTFPAPDPPKQLPAEDQKRITQ